MSAEDLGAANSLQEVCGHYAAASLTPKYESTGYENDPTSGLRTLRQERFYDPQMTSFLTHDPAGPR